MGQGSGAYDGETGMANDAQDGEKSASRIDGARGTTVEEMLEIVDKAIDALRSSRFARSTSQPPAANQTPKSS
jgi:hypothetical protein